MCSTRRIPSKVYGAFSNCIMVTETTFFLNSLRVRIAVEITSPHFLQFQVIKIMCHHLTNCFWYQTLIPNTEFLSSNQSPPQYQESLIQLAGLIFNPMLPAGCIASFKTTEYVSDVDKTLFTISLLFSTLVCNWLTCNRSNLWITGILK